jgi:hypothetical protein
MGILIVIFMPCVHHYKLGRSGEQIISLVHRSLGHMELPKEDPTTPGNFGH